MSVQKPKLKFKEERMVKEVSMDIIGVRTAFNPDTYKNISANFLIHLKISVENSKHFTDIFLSKLTFPYRFTWMKEQRLKIKIYVHRDGGQMTEEVYITSPEPLGLVFEFSEPKKISQKEAQALLDAGSRVFALDENDNLSSLPIYGNPR